MKNLSLFTIIFASMLFVSPMASGQFTPPPPNDSSGNPDFEDDTDDEIIPIDGLIALGLLAGAVYGIRKKQ